MTDPSITNQAGYIQDMINWLNQKSINTKSRKGCTLHYRVVSSIVIATITVVNPDYAQILCF